jgi:hypothetical protein
MLSTELRHHYSRQALSEHEAIQIAFQQAKDRGRTSAPGISHGNVAIELALKKIAVLEAKVQLQKEILDRYDLQFQRWSYNAANRGLTPEQLEQGLPPGTGEGKE